MNAPELLINEHYDDRYFDVVNAIEEARQVFFDGSALSERLRSYQGTQSVFQIAETGFGAGRMLVALMQYLDNLDLHDVKVHYSSVELHPIRLERMTTILDIFRQQAGGYIDQLADSYRTINIEQHGVHEARIQCGASTIFFDLWICEALEMAKFLEKPVDAWFLEGHGPKKNPMMWRPELLDAIGKKTIEGGTFATFTVAGHVRRALQSAGFTVERWQGFGGKKSVMRGIKQSSSSIVLQV